jgi:hypothetical protein
MQATGKLFRVELTGNQIWEMYIGSFAPENNPVFRSPESSTHNCNHCKNLIRRYGNVVAIDTAYNIVTMFDVDTDGEYQNTARVLSAAIKQSRVADVFFETFAELQKLPYESCSQSQAEYQLGTAQNVKQYTQEHRKVLEVLGATNMIESSENQLSGLGFNATVRDEVVLKLQGSHKRAVRVKI